MISGSVTAQITLRHCSPPLTQSAQGHPVCRTTAALRGPQHLISGEQSTPVTRLFNICHTSPHHCSVLRGQVGHPRALNAAQLREVVLLPDIRWGRRHMKSFYGASTALCSSAQHLAPAHHLFTEPEHLKTGFGKDEDLCKLMGFTKRCLCLMSRHISFTGKGGAHTPFFLHHLTIHKNPFIVITQYRGVLLPNALSHPRHLTSTTSCRSSMYLSSV